MRLKAQHIIQFSIAFSSIFLLFSCEKPKDTSKIIASVYDHQLMEEDVIDQFGKEILLDQDALERIVDKWVRKNLMLDAASKKISSKKEIDELVESYRQTLVVQKHKEAYQIKNLDKNISEEELLEEYELIKNEYKLQSSIFKMELLLSPADHFDKLDLKNSFKKKDFDEWRSSLANQVDMHLQDTTVWYSWKKLQQFIPSDLLEEENIKENSNFSLENNEHLFFLRIFELIDKSEIPPLSYMKPKLERIILERRKELLLKNYSSDLYNKALKTNKIKING